MRAQSLIAGAVVLAGCGASEQQEAASAFALGAPVEAVVTENVTACVVDAVCGLRLDFSDTTVFALYGGGERSAPACEIPTEVSDVAFSLQGGETVSLVLRECPGMGLIVESLDGGR